MIEQEKIRLTEKFEKDLNVAEINIKIERSSELNKVRIQKMRKINEMVEGLQHEASVKLANDLKKNPDEYAKLIKNLLVQGCIKLIEPAITLKVRKSDLALVKG